MWQTGTIILITGLAFFFIGRKLYRQLRQAADPSQQISCGCSCSGCGESKCSSRPIEDDSIRNSPPFQHLSNTNNQCNLH
ncbi:MAG: FeoB-associated Cys-rich membrane protein [Proteobacteria bacterium]|nr:FeoB-associated Cys-rich membrane protein [Pseudomonadota bacterium]MBU1138268.1 FeoB-associated Cys-rich membrane protein [Pseudomonadota bacterium]MBU1234761.1 FeoB-associated Cys-rich membrane protein [Pseudomonadota bacterium]MBU1420663.1 FeoB-associated Cys-rich membrane protein [Pseudomonadota bacterium]MBU1454315.1 FeoB-associated Cys-rich membrane protein [Pseudomonadota bacterium]